MKICFKCHVSKPLSDFYKHPQMGDGHLNKCKDCTKKDTKERTDWLWANDPEWVEKELARQRLKERNRRELGIAHQATPEEELFRTRKYRRENPDKNRAHSAVNFAIKSGRLQKLPCAVCGSDNTHGHHDDYSKPLDVLWLCPKHHFERHVLLRQQARKAKQLLK